MRFAFFDESGIGKISAEPWTTVAGIMLHVDDQYDPLSKYLLDMADELVGKDRPLDFVFHAKELFNGGGFFPREQWPEAKRHEILHHLCDIPQKWELIIFHSCIKREDFPPKDPTAKNASALATRRCHLLSFLSCLHQVDKFMEEELAGEKAMVVVENHNDHRMILLETAQMLGDKRLAEVIENNPNIYWKPHRHLVAEPLFQNKSGQSPLQIADVCAYLIAKHLRGDDRALPFVEKLKPRLAVGWRENFFRVMPNETSSVAPIS